MDCFRLCLHAMISVFCEECADEKEKRMNVKRGTYNCDISAVFTNYDIHRWISRSLTYFYAEPLLLRISQCLHFDSELSDTEQ